MKDIKRKQSIWMFVGILFVLLVWQVLSLLADSEQLMPSPGSTVLALLKLYQDTHFLASIAITILRGLGGIIISLITGCTLAFISSKSDAFRAFLTPSVLILRSTPVISFILLAIVWLASDQVPVFIAILTMLPIIYSNVLEGLIQMDRNLMKMTKIFHIRFKDALTHLYWPSVQGYFYTGLSTSLGFGWRAIIVGEVLAHPQFGIGTALKNAQTYLEVDKIIAWTIIGILISAIFDKVINSLKTKSMKWQSA